MKRTRLFIIAFLIGILGFSINWAISSGKSSEREARNKVDTRIDNLQYWVNMAEKGYIDYNPDIKVPMGTFTGSQIKAYSVITEDSPDVPVTEVNSTQSENSVFVDPNNADVVLNSNNSTQNPVGSLYGANDFHSFDAAETWEGQVQGAGGGNSGDPTTAIGLNGRWYVNYIDNPGGMGISYSDDQGGTWTAVTVAPNPGSLADKNHMWIDNSPTSPYEGNIYVAWTNFGGGSDTEIAISTSTDDGLTWTTNNNISGAVNAGNHNQGVNISVGPNGEVYVIWAIYDGWPSDESAIGMAVSYDGGATFEPAERIITNIRGIRSTETSKNMRVNAFPVGAVDNSNGPNRGAIYVAWTNVGTPGVNTGNDIDTYISKSTDNGATWSTPIKMNQDESGLGKEHYFPWITVDPSNGVISAIFYDDRNVSSNQAEVYCANSEDGGLTWEDFKVSDVSFTPSAIPGLAGGYFGDYLSIYAQDGWVYPVWTDNRTGSAMTYCSPYQTNPLNRPTDMVGTITFETGACDLIWTYIEGENFVGFNLYREGELIASELTDTTYMDMLPDYGIYTYQVTATYTEDMESSATGTSVQWGDAHIAVSPLEIHESLVVDTMSTKQITVINTGQLELVYNISTFIQEDREILEYCDAFGGGDEYISRVTFGDIDNESASSFYADYTDQQTTVEIGGSYPITVENGNGYNQDQCAAWVDWDQNGEFDDGIIYFNGSPGNGPYVANIEPPVGAATGETRMRVRIRYTGELFPCGNTQYGEVEDYTVNVQGWLDISPTFGAVQPGDTTVIEITFDSHDMDPGEYAATAMFSSNDPMANEVQVNLGLTITSMLVDVNATSETLCIGEETLLTTDIYGVQGSLTYEWTSNPAGFTSSDTDVTVLPEENTWYFVHVTDTSGVSSTDSVYIMVYDLPVVNIGADTTFCPNIVWTLDAGNSGSSYLWSNGAETQTISVDTVGYGYGVQEFAVEVTNQNGCVETDEIALEFVDCTGINELENTVNVNVYPNPSNGIFNLKINAEKSSLVEIMVVSANGRVVYNKSDVNLNGESNINVDLSTYAKGAYQLIIRSDKGMINKKLILK